MFNADNTDGQYTQVQINTMNARVMELVNNGYDEKNAMDRVATEFDSEIG